MMRREVHRGPARGESPANLIRARPHRGRAVAAALYVALATSCAFKTLPPLLRGSSGLRKMRAGVL